MHSDLALKVIMDCRADESCNLKRNLGFRIHDVIDKKEPTVLKSIKGAFKVFSAIGLIFTSISTNLQLKLMI